MGTLYLPPAGAIPDTPAIGTMSAASATATTITVSTVQGTFPSPGAGQAFIAVLNPNTSGLIDNATTERCIVTVNSSGTWTIPAGLAHNHGSGEYVALVLSTTWLTDLVQTGTSSSGAIPVANGSGGYAWQTPTPVPLPGAVNLQGHSYLDAGLPDPMAKGRSLGSRIAGMLGAPNDSVVSMVQAGGFLLGTGADGCGWGTFLNRILPPTAIGLTGRANLGSGEVYTWGGQVNPPLPAVAQPTGVSFIGLNDIYADYGVGFVPFTASLTGVGGSMTSATNLSSTGTYAAGRSGGNGIQVASVTAISKGYTATITGGISGTGTVNSGSFLATDVGLAISGTGIPANSYIIGVTPGTSCTINNTLTTETSETVTLSGTAITFANTAQVLSAQVAQSYNVVFNATSGTSTFTNQGAAAMVNCWSACVARHVAGAVVRSDDAVSGGGIPAGYNGALTYSGTWTQPAVVGANTGPVVAQTTVNGSAVSYTFPSTHPGGMVSLIGVGTTDLDTSACYVTIGGTSAAGVAGGTVTVARAGWAGLAAPVVIRIKTTAADAGKTITLTFNSGSGGTNDIHQFQFDSINFDAPYQSPFIMVTQPIVASFPSAEAAISALNTAIATVASNFQTAPSGGFPAIGNITPNYTNVVVADFAAEINKRSFYLGSTITTSTTTPITLIGQQTTASGLQQPPYAGQQICIPSANVGDENEVALITAVLSGPTPSGPGSAYPSWTVTLTRNAVAGTGNLQAVAATGSTSSLISPIYDMMWMGADYGHPGDVGSSLVGSLVLSTYLAVPNTANLDFVAAGSQRWLQGRTQPYPRAYDGGVWFPKGTSGNLTTATNTAYALRYYASEDQVVTGIGVHNGVSGSSVAYFGILMDASYGSYPGTCLTDFGLANVALNNNANFGLSNLDQLLKPGWYWLVVAFNSGTPGTSAIKSLCNRSDEPTIDAISIATAPITGTNQGIIGYSWTPTTSGATITNIAPTAAIAPGTAAQVLGTASTAALPIIYLQRNVQKY